MDRSYFYLRLFDYAVAAALLVLYFAVRRPKAQPERPTAGFGYLSLALIAVGLVARTIDQTSFLGGNLSADEYALSRVYVDRLLSLRPFISGVTQAFHATLLVTWYELFGISAASARTFSAVLALCGLGVFYLVARRLLGRDIAGLATGFISVTSYAVLFSKLALEVVAIFCFLPLSLLLLSYLPRAVWYGAAIIGAAVGLSLFTYPGYVLALIAIAGAVGCIAALYKLTGREIYRISMPSIGSQRICWFAGGFGAVVVFALYLHFTFLFGGRGPFTGGGAVAVSNDFFGVLHLLLQELTVGPWSYYLIYPDTPLVESWLLALALIGVHARWSSRGSLEKILALSVPLLWLLLPFTGAGVGGRRLLYVILPIAALGAVGLRELGSQFPRRISESILVLVLCSVAVRAMLNWQLWHRSDLETGYCSTLLPDDLLLNSGMPTPLAEAREFPYWLDSEALHATVRLGKMFENVPVTRTLQFSRVSEARTVDSAWVTCNPLLFRSLAEESGHCLDLSPTGLECRQGVPL